MQQKVVVLVILLIIYIYVFGPEKVVRFFKRDCDTVTYYIRPSTLDTSFKPAVKKILRGSKWTTVHPVKEVDERDAADITIELRRNEDIPSMSPPRYREDGSPLLFSVTVQGPEHPPTIYINETNWREGVRQSALSLRDYRQYVIEHEFGHALGYNHQPCDQTTMRNGRCPVMYQSTRGCPQGVQCGYEPVDSDLKDLLSVRYGVIDAKLGRR